MRRTSVRKKHPFKHIVLCAIAFVTVFFTANLFSSQEAEVFFPDSATATSSRPISSRGIIFDRRLQVLARDSKKKKQRLYPQRHQAAHIIGFAAEGEGLAGLEFSFNPLLTGTIPADFLVSEDFRNIGQYGRNGFHLVSTLNLAVQRRLENLLGQSEGQQKDGIRTAAGAVIHVGSGEILAMTSRPGFDPNRFWEASTRTYSNAFLHSTLPLGSFADLIRKAFLQQNDKVQGGHRTDPRIHEDAMARFAIKRLGLKKNLLPEAAQLPSFPLSYSNGVLHIPATQVTPLQLLTILTSLASGTATRPVLAEALIDRSSGKVLPRVTAKAPSASRPYWGDAALPIILTNTDQSPEKEEETSRQTAFAAACLFTRDNERYIALLYFSDPAGEAIEKRKEQLLLLADTLQNGPDLRPPLPADLPLMGPSLLPVHLAAPKNREAKRTGAPAPPADVTTMPRIVGLSLREGLAHLSGMPFSIEIQGTGSIVSQFPLPGARIATPTRCRLQLAGAPTHSAR